MPLLYCFSPSGLKSLAMCVPAILSRLQNHSLPHPRCLPLPFARQNISQPLGRHINVREMTYTWGCPSRTAQAPRTARTARSESSGRIESAIGPAEKPFPSRIGAGTGHLIYQRIGRVSRAGPDPGPQLPFGAPPVVVDDVPPASAAAVSPGGGPIHIWCQITCPCREWRPRSTKLSGSLPVAAGSAPPAGQLAPDYVPSLRTVPMVPTFPNCHPRCLSSGLTQLVSVSPAQRRGVVAVVDPGFLYQFTVPRVSFTQCIRASRPGLG